MKPLVLALCAAAWACHAFAQTSTETRPKAVDYIARDNYSGVMVTDSFRIFEQTDHPVTQAWVRAQNLATDNYLKTIPFLDDATARVRALADYDRFYKLKSGPDGALYYLKQGLENQPALYRRRGAGQPELILSPERYSPDSTTALSEYSLSPDGRFLAYLVSPNGSDQQIACFLDLRTGCALPDVLKGLKFSNFTWSGDGGYYQRFPDGDIFDKNEHARIYFHTLGQSQTADQLIWEDRQNPNTIFETQVFGNSPDLVITSASATSKNALFVRTGAGKVIAVVADDRQADYMPVGLIDNKLYVRTNDSAPNWRLVEVDLLRPDRANWRTVLPEHATNVLQDCKLANGKLLAHYLVNCSSALFVYSLDGSRSKQVGLPATIGSISELEASSDSKLAFFTWENFTLPASVFRFSVEEPEAVAPVMRPLAPFDSDRYETVQYWATSKDGARIPFFLTQRKGRAEGPTPCLLYGYGGFNIPVLPRFRLFSSAFLDAGGIYVSANLRGGAEFGEDWHQSGTRENKQRVFDDFIAVAEYLIAHGYTSRDLLAINGASNGGLLIGACMTQRPDLFGVCLPQVGVLDMLRFQESTVGAHWATDYGLSDTPEGFAYLYAYSPLHNVKPEKYPATLILTGAQDDRVSPWHSFKFAAALQANQRGGSPVLLRVTSGAGHGAGKSLGKAIDEVGAMLAFTLFNMKVPYKSMQ
ncbi:MAG: prolyl oligopeptidase family serine peptidase [Saprospiraceae bacterium]